MIGIETAYRVKVEHDAKVLKLEEDNKQEMELKEIEVKELMELRNIGIETADRVKVEHDAKVLKLEEDM